MGLKGKMEIYKKAPTFLYNKDGDSKLFETQKQVDQAWKEGWFGPPWMLRDTPPISEQTFETKAMMEEALLRDPRYEGCKIVVSRSAAECLERIVKFELEKGIISPEPYPDDEDEDDEE